MLGIVFWGQTQVDVWCGDIEKFECDVILRSNVSLAENLFLEEKLLKQHVLITNFSRLQNGSGLYAEYKDLIAKLASLKLTPRRITFAANDLSAYENLQDLLLATQIN